MIPVTLRLQNFLSYGSPLQTISFDHYKLICLSGKNGHGKSALLDAITWALWGQARKTSSTSKADLGVVKLGQTDVMVIFDFIFNNNMYRVKRVYSTKYGKPKAHIDFGTYNPETDYFSALTEKTIKKTQECINTTLGLDFEGFINSSFLRQGQANEFSKKSPKERKQVIGTILGLTQYEQAKKYTLEQMRIKQQERDSFDKLTQVLAEECLQKESVEKELTCALQELTKIQSQEKETQKAIEALEKEEKILQIKEQEYQLLLFKKEQQVKEKDELITQGKKIAETWHNIHAQLLKIPHKRELEKEQQTITTRISEYQKKIQESFSLKEELLQCKTNLQQYITEHQNKNNIALQALHKEYEKVCLIQEHEKEKLQKLELEKIAIQKEYQATEVSIKQLTTSHNLHALINDTQELQKLFDKHKLFYYKWIEQGNHTNKELQSIIEKQQMAQDNENPSCPLCEQNLSQGRKKFLHKKFNEKKLFLIHRFNRLKKLIEKTKTTLHTIHTTLETSKKIDAIFKEQEQLQKAQDSNNEKQEKIKKYIQELIQQATTLEQKKIILSQEQEKQLFNTPQYQTIKNKQANLEKALKALQPQEQELATLQKKQDDIHQILQKLQAIIQEEPLQKERKKQIHTLALQVRQKKQALALITTELINYKTHKIHYEKINLNKKDLRIKLQTIIQEKETLIQQKSSLETRLKKLHEQQSLYATTLKKYEAAHQEAQDLQAIAQALSKDGIQALLIEEALPEIEQEANHLLARLTDNQTHIFIESLRDLKKGGTKETLDINISDSSGIRPYELFSGGEAFRIDFALRIAISKLLARRAGTSLQTLIIDEGFGSQDEEGLSKIMDILYAIQDDFEKIIIVSHLPSMKDQFPVHFIVSKGPQGSKVSIKEQG